MKEALLQIWDEFGRRLPRLILVYLLTAVAGGVFFLIAVTIIHLFQ